MGLLCVAIDEKTRSYTVLYVVEILKKVLNFLLSSAFLKYLTRGPQQSILEKKIFDVLNCHKVELWHEKHEFNNQGQRESRFLRVAFSEKF